MSLTAVAKKEFRDTIRSRSLFVVTGLFLLWAGFLVTIQHIPDTYPQSSVPISTRALLNSMKQSSAFVALIGLGLGYNAIAGERESGRYKLLLGLPNSRRDVVYGKFLGRTAVVAVAILVSHTVTALIALVTYDSFAVAPVALYTFFTFFYGAVHIAVALAISVALTSRLRALAVTALLYGFFWFFWALALVSIQQLLIGIRNPDWFVLLGMLNPSNAFEHATIAFVPGVADLTTKVRPDGPFLHDSFGLVILMFWMVLPLYLGYRRFRTMDLPT
jgi:ABC-2 type transport system permease protein